MSIFIHHFQHLFHISYIFHLYSTYLVLISQSLQGCSSTPTWEFGALLEYLLRMSLNLLFTFKTLFLFDFPTPNFFLSHGFFFFLPPYGGFFFSYFRPTSLTLLFISPSLPLSLSIFFKYKRCMQGFGNEGFKEKMKEKVFSSFLTISLPLKNKVADLFYLNIICHFGPSSCVIFILVPLFVIPLYITPCSLKSHLMYFSLAIPFIITFSF